MRDSNEKAGSYVRYTGDDSIPSSNTQSTVNQQQQYQNRQRQQMNILTAGQPTPDYNSQQVMNANQGRIYDRSQMTQYIPNANIPYGVIDNQTQQQQQQQHDYTMIRHQIPQQQQQRPFLPSLISDQHKGIINTNPMAPSNIHYQRVPIQLPYILEQRQHVPNRLPSTMQQQYINASQIQEQHLIDDSNARALAASEGSLALQHPNFLGQVNLGSSSSSGSTSGYLRGISDSASITSVSTPVSSVSAVTPLSSTSTHSGKRSMRITKPHSGKSQDGKPTKGKRGRKPNSKNAKSLLSNTDSGHHSEHNTTPEIVAKKIAEENIDKTVGEFAVQVREAELQVLNLDNQNGSKLEKQSAEQARERSKQAFASLWLMKNCILQPGAYVRRGRIFAQYVSSCAQNGLKPLSQATLGKLIRSLYPNLTTRRLGMRGQSKYHYCGLKLTTDDSLSMLLEQQQKTSSSRPPQLKRNVVHRHYSDSSLPGGNRNSPSPTSIIPNDRDIKTKLKDDWSQNGVDQINSRRHLATKSVTRYSAPTIIGPSRDSPRLSDSPMSLTGSATTVSSTAQSDFHLPIGGSATYFENGNIFYNPLTKNLSSFISTPGSRFVVSDAHSHHDGDVASAQQTEKFDLQQRESRRPGLFWSKSVERWLFISDLLKDWLPGGEEESSVSGENKNSSSATGNITETEDTRIEDKDGEPVSGVDVDHDEKPDVKSDSDSTLEAGIVVVSGRRLPEIPLGIIPAGTDTDITAALQSLYHIHCNTLFENVRFLNFERLANNLFLSSSGAISPQMYNLLISEELYDWIIECDTLTYVAILNYISPMLLQFKSIDQTTQDKWEILANTFYDIISKSTIDLPSTLVNKKLETVTTFLRLLKQQLKLLQTLRSLDDKYFGANCNTEELERSWEEKILPNALESLELISGNENYNIGSNLVKFFRENILTLLPNANNSDQHGMQTFFNDLCAFYQSMDGVTTFQLADCTSQLFGKTVGNLVIDEESYTPAWLLLGSFSTQLTGYLSDLSKFV